MLDCKAKTLSEASGLSATVISRYRTGERLPAVRSPQLNQLCHGIALLAEQRSLPDLSGKIFTLLLWRFLTKTGSILLYLARNPYYHHLSVRHQ